MSMDFEAGTAALASAAPEQDRFGPLLRKSFSAHGIFLVLALAYLATFKLLNAEVPGMALNSGLEVALGIMFFSVPMALFALLGFKFIEMAIYEKPEHPLPTLWRNFKGVLTSREQMALGLPMFVSLVIFMYVFTMLKANISVLAPFSWDQTFDHWDRVLHFGYRPWELLQPIFGYWPVTFLINFNYNLWFVMMNVFWVYYAFLAKPGEERTRYYLSFMLIWMVGGGLLAVYFSSAGPCFFGDGRLGFSPDPYAPLMDYLRGANEHLPIWAIGTQDMLWDYRMEGSAFGGVSAMPSMHNATALLFVLASTGRPLWVRRAVVVHFILIFLGSIHLGWHYAVDSYLAWALTLAVWWAMGPVARWWENTRQARDFSDAVPAGA